MLFRYEKTFAFENLSNCPNPDKVLLHAFDRAINEACEESLSTVYKIGVRIDSEALEYPAGLTFDHSWKTTPYACVNLFKKIQQSKKAVDLFSFPMTVKVTVLGKQRGGRVRKNVKLYMGINEQSLIMIRNPRDNFCLFHAVEMTRLYSLLGTGNAPPGMTRRHFNRMLERGPNYRRGRGTANEWGMSDYAFHLMTAIGAPRDLDDYSVEDWMPRIQEYYSQQYPEKRYRISVFNKYSDLRPTYKGQVADPLHELGIWHDATHFHGVRTIASIFDKNYYCVDCERSYQNRKEHTLKCKRRCRKCARMGPDFPCQPEENFSRFCPLCNNAFWNMSCWQEHIRAKVCEEFKRCLDCGAGYNVKKVQKLSPGGKHQCYTIFCHRYHCYHARTTGCFTAPLKSDEDPKKARFVAFDFELEQIPQEDMPTEKEHKVNCATATVFCDDCIANGKYKDENSPPDCEVCAVPQRTYVWNGAERDDPLDDFMKWLLSLDPTNETIFSHYGGRYDMVLASGWVFDRGGMRPSFVQTGNKIYQLTLPAKAGSPKTTFRDSYLLVTRPLSELKEAFGLSNEDVDDKGYFPHFYNRPENYFVVSDTLPDKEQYGYSSMKKAAQSKFDDWYQENLHTRFVLAEELESYCKKDTLLLKHALVNLSKEWKAITGDNILYHAMTVASACMRHFRLNHLKDIQLAVSPELGYEKHDLQSTIALKWLKWYAVQEQPNLDIRQRDNGGEVRFGKYRVDGFLMREPQARNKVLEFNGCCPSCFKDNPDHRQANGNTAEQNYAEYETKKNFLERDHNVEVETKWECELAEELKENEEMREDFEKIPSFGPILPRDAFFGGRTGPVSIACDVEDSLGKYGIKYTDITSLYPTMVVANKDVQWTEPSHVPYKGILKVFIVPPKNLQLPVLPAKWGDHLLFSLCRQCSVDYRKKHTVVNSYKCEHTDEQRGFVSTHVHTTTHRELEVALQNGYVVTKFDRAYSWDLWSDDIFKGYVREFIKIKTEASGWDEGIDEEGKQTFIKEFADLYDVTIEEANMQDNPARRSIAKMCLNSLWGKFCMRNNLAKHLVTESASDYFDIICNPSFDLHTAEMIGEKAAMVSYSSKRDYTEEGPYFNIFLSIFVTSEARLCLYKFMRDIHDDPYCKLLYTDTDSCIFRFTRGKELPIKSSKVLGQMSDEYPKHEILSYYSGGCKAYGLKLRSLANGEVSYSIKLRGITLDGDAARSIHFDSFRDQVLSYYRWQPGEPPAEPLRVNTTRFKLKKGKIFTCPFNKIYTAIFKKGLVLRDSLDIVPFGFELR